MGRRDLLSAEERRHLFGVPVDRDALARLYTFEPADLSLIEARREERNRLGFAVQLALIRHPGLTLAQIAAQPGVDLEPLVGFIASQLDLPSAVLTDYAAREQTMTDHAREIGAALGLRPPVRTDLSMMIEAAASAAWSTDRGAAIAGAVVAVLREKAIMLPAPATIERAGITGRATARKRVHDALLTGLGPEQLAALDELLTLDPVTGFTRLTMLRTIPSGPKPDHVREIIDKLGVVRTVGIAHDAVDRIHPRQWPARALLAVRRALLRNLDEAALLQHRLGPGVAQVEARLADLLVEVLGREVEVARPVLLEHPLDLVCRRPPPRGPTPPPVHQPLRPLGLVGVTQAAKMPLADPQKLRRLHAAEPPGPIPRQSLQIPRHPHLRPHPDPPARPKGQTGQIVCYENRTYRLLATPLATRLRAALALA